MGQVVMSFSRQVVLVTGGAGYIGSHTVVKLLEAGCKVVVLDNLCNSNPEVINRIEKITAQRPELIVGDIRDAHTLRSIFSSQRIHAVIHFAGLKAVGESVAHPLKYYENNVCGTVNLVEEMKRADIKTLVFSSSATVYGNPASVPINEGFPLRPTNPYGQSKLMVEQILQDLYKSDSSWCIAQLRYFNPGGAHPSGLMGEDPNGVPNNLIPYIAQVAVGKYEKLLVFGDDYSTRDGTGVRDYIHVEDLARGHLAALEALSSKQGLISVNLGTGRGYSVIEIIRAFEKASGFSIPYEICSRRAGDVAECFADPTKARDQLNWLARYSVDEMCVDAWRWQSMNPCGYKT